MKPFKTAFVLGGGAFGTSVATVLSKNFEKVVLVVRSKDVYEGINDGENSVYLKGNKLPKNLVAAYNFVEAMEKTNEKVELIVSGLPTSAITEFIFDNFEPMTKLLQLDIPVVSLSKGIDPETLELSDELFANFFPEFMDQFSFLSGPSFAKEIVEKQITLVSLAGKSKPHLERSIKMLHSDYFKLFPTYDIKGVLLGGALKNILAIAGGLIEGLGYNHNTRAALITRGIAEMLRFGLVYNARPETFYGLSGMGDLILTTTGSLSRNKTFGLEIASGRSAKEIIESQRRVVEGYKTTKAVYKIKDKYGIKAVIFEGVYRILYDDVSPEEIIQEIMATPPRLHIE